MHKELFRVNCWSCRVEMGNKIFCIFAFLLVTISSASASDQRHNVKVSCKDEQGNNVDWFYMYKLPKHYSNNRKVVQDSSGFNYLFITDQSADTWHFSTEKVTELSSMTGRTLQPLFEDASVLLLAYNDEFPNGTAILTQGHTKGLLATDGVTAIWLVHSVPKFPSIPEYSYPHSGAVYGQSFLCVTLNATEVHKVGQQMLYNQPQIYYVREPPALAERFPILQQAIVKEWVTERPFNNLVDIRTLAGTEFKSFAKSSNYNQGLYEDFVAPALDNSLLVESWRNGGENLLSNCSRKTNVYNIQAIALDDLGIEFESTHDHSKWAVSPAVGFKVWRWRFSGTNWICVGDINRQKHQFQRGGGTLCQNSSKVARLFRKLVKAYELCE